MQVQKIENCAAAAAKVRSRSSEPIEQPTIEQREQRIINKSSQSLLANPLLLIVVRVRPFLSSLKYLAASSSSSSSLGAALSLSRSQVIPFSG